jgi:hypothetical protein
VARELQETKQWSKVLEFEMGKSNNGEIWNEWRLLVFWVAVVVGLRKTRR